MNYKTLQFNESNYTVKTLTTDDERIQSYKLRYIIFVETLHWIKENESKQDIDSHDNGACNIGVIKDNELFGSIRILLPEYRFMIEEEFAALVPPTYTIQKSTDTAELTRLAVSPILHNASETNKILMLILKGAYRWAVDNNVRYYYLETSYVFFKHLNMFGFYCDQIGEVVEVKPARTRTTAAIFDISNFKKKNSIQRPDLLRWMQS